MPIETVTLLEVIAAARAERAALVPESAGYVMLGLGRAMAAVPMRLDLGHVLLTTEGAVVFDGPKTATRTEKAVTSLRKLLGELLDLSHGSAPALRHLADGAGDDDVQAFFTAIAKALIPINRAAAKRALARLAREALKAKLDGALEEHRASGPAGKPSAAPVRAEQSKRRSSAAVKAPPPRVTPSPSPAMPEAVATPSPPLTPTYVDAELGEQHDRTSFEEEVLRAAAARAAMEKQLAASSDARPAPSRARPSTPSGESSKDELAKAEQAKAELSKEIARAQAAKAELAKAEQAKAELAKELAKAEVAKAELMRAERAKAEAAKAELAKELARAEAAKAELAKAELAKAELAKAELAKAELAREIAKAELDRAEKLSKAEVAKAEIAKELAKAEIAKELAKAELIKAEELAKTEQARVELAKAEAIANAKIAKAEKLAQAELAKIELAKAELAKAEVAKAEQVKAELARVELARAELAQAGQATVELAQAELAKIELAKAELARVELAKTELAKAEQSQASVSGSDTSHEAADDNGVGTRRRAASSRRGAEPDSRSLGPASVETLLDRFGRSADLDAVLRDAARSLGQMGQLALTPHPSATAAIIDPLDDDMDKEQPATPSHSIDIDFSPSIDEARTSSTPAGHSLSDHVSSVPPLAVERRPSGRRRLWASTALLFVGAASLSAVMVSRPDLVSGAGRQRSTPAPAAAADKCVAELTLKGLPQPHEVLVRLGTAPLTTRQLPTGVRLELVALAPDHLPRRIVVAPDATWTKGGVRALDLEAKLEPGVLTDWPSAPPGEVGGSGPAGVIHFSATPVSTELWLVTGAGDASDAKVSLPCDQTAHILVVDIDQPSQRKRLTVEPDLLAAAARTGEGELSY